MHASRPLPNSLRRRFSAAFQVRHYSWYFHDTGCKLTADGLSLLLAHRPETHCLTIWYSSVTRDSFRRLLKTHLFALYWSIQRIKGFTKMRYTNILLTYLLRTDVLCYSNLFWTTGLVDYVIWFCGIYCMHVVPYRTLLVLVTMVIRTKTKSDRTEIKTKTKTKLDIGN